jgi:dTDP-4-amino-4,6-dideoxy-D-galactose acyltransferase
VSTVDIRFEAQAAMDETRSEVFRELSWDSKHFGLKIGRVTQCGSDIPKQAVERATEMGLDCLYLLVDSEDAATLRSAAAAGFRMVDIRVTLSGEVPHTADQGGIRIATPDDVPFLSRIAMRCHRDSRFYTDGRFSVIRSDALFAAWIERSCTDHSFAGAVFVAEADGEPAGYVTCALKGGLGEIGLIAVDQSYRGRGLGGTLLEQAYGWFFAQSALRVKVVTQGSNVKALRMYERAGFRIDTVQVWFHWWRL